MKRKCVIWLLIALLTASLLSGCGTKGVETGLSMDQAAAEIPMPEEMESLASAGYDGGAASASSSTAPDAKSDAKIIYTADLELEATDFDAAVSAIKALTEDCGGYFSSSSLSNGGSYRSASYTVRVPADKYRDFLDRAGETAHLLDLYEYADDVSEQYYDTSGRLRTQQTKLDRLQELLAKAKSMEDIISIESAISDTEEQIDWLAGTLSRYDSQVELASVDVSLREVSRLSDVPEPAQSLGQRIAASFRAGLAAFAQWAEDLLAALAYSWIWLLLALIVLLVVVLLIRRAVKKRKK